MHRHRIILLFVAALGSAALNSRAAFLAPTAWSRGDPYSTYQQWQVFSSPAGPNAPDVGEFPDATTLPHPPRADVVDTSGGAFVTGGGNIYSFSVPIDIDVTVPDYDLGAGYVTTVILQTRSLGTETDYASVRLTYNDGTDHTISPSLPRLELARIPLGGFGGDDVESAYEFHVPHSAGELKIEFIAQGSSMSLDALAVDTLTTRNTDSSPLLNGMNSSLGFAATPVPEPAGSLAALVVAALAARRRSTT